MNNNIKILSTKKLHTDLVTRLAERPGIYYIESAFIETAALPFIPPALQADKQSQTAMVFTSGNAVTPVAAKSDMLAPELMDIFCLSGHTKEMIIDHWGADRIKGIAPDAAGLAKLIIATAEYRSVLFFCSSSRRDTLPDILRDQGIDVQEVNVYGTTLTPHKVGILPDVVLFFSPSAVHSFFSLNQLADSVICGVIGAATANAILEYGRNYRIIASPCPDQEALLHHVFKQLQLLII